MAKRFTDTEIWDKQWFMLMNPKMKCFVKYVRDKCDLAGIWHPNYILANVYIGEPVTEEELLAVDDGKQFRRLPDGKIFCVDFIPFQYGNTLNPTSPIHKKILDILKKYEISYETHKVEAKKDFTPPTQDEVMEEMKTKVDEYIAKAESEKFINYYEAIGWVVGKKKMKSWKAAVAGWLNRNKPVSQESIKERLNKIGNIKYADL